MGVDLTTLVERAIGGKPLQYDRLFRPSWFYFMDQDPFWLWCHYHAPENERFDETTRFDEHRMIQGNEWESRYIAERFPEAYCVQARWNDGALHETLAAMLRGERAIQGAALWLLGDEIYG